MSRSKRDRRRSMAMIQAFSSSDTYKTRRDSNLSAFSEISEGSSRATNSSIDQRHSVDTNVSSIGSLTKSNVSNQNSSNKNSEMSRRSMYARSSSLSNTGSHRSTYSNISVSELFSQAHDPTSTFSTEGVAPTKTSRQQKQAARQAKNFTDGLLKTSLHLINEKDKYLQNLENMLLPLLDSLLSSGTAGPYQQQLIDAHQWALSQFVDGGVSLPGASRYDVRLCGWLGKLGRNGTKIQKRWIELSGQTLSYFADEKTGLELRGCLDLEGCTCRPLPPTRKGLCSFELRAGGERGRRVIKKVNNSSKTGKYKEKSSYKFSVADQDELSMWIVAIQEAINQPELSRVKRVVGAISKIYAVEDSDERITQYVSKLKSMEGDRWLVFPSDWLHQQVLMKTARQTGKTIEGPVMDDRHQAKDLAQVYKDVVRDTMVIDGQTFVCANGDVIIQTLFVKIYDMFRSQYGFGSRSGGGEGEGYEDGNEDGDGDGNEDGDGDGDGDSDEDGDAGDHNFNVERDHFITKNALAYTRAVLLASCRTVSGGDTYDAVDFMLRNEEISVVCPDNNFQAPVKIEIFYPTKSYDNNVSEVLHWNQRARAATTGTKSTSDLKSFTTMISPLVATAGWTSTPPQNVSDDKNKTGPATATISSSASFPSSATKSRSMGHTRAATSTTGGTSTNVMHRTESGRQSKLQGLRARFRSPEEKDVKNNTNNEDRNASTGMHVGYSSSKDSMEMSPEELETLEAMIWPTVRVDVESRYRVMDADPFCGRSDDPLIATVQTTFTRSFAWGRHTYCKPAEVLVKILPSEREDEDVEDKADQEVEEDEKTLSF